MRISTAQVPQRFPVAKLAIDGSLSAVLSTMGLEDRALFQLNVGRGPLVCRPASHRQRPWAVQHLSSNIRSVGSRRCRLVRARVNLSLAAKEAGVK